MYATLNLDQQDVKISSLGIRPLFFVRWYFR